MSIYSVEICYSQRIVKLQYVLKIGPRGLDAPRLVKMQLSHLRANHLDYQLNMLIRFVYLGVLVSVR